MTKTKNKFCSTPQENPICHTEECSCGKPILLFRNFRKESLDSLKLSELVEIYCVISNALNDYRERNGFKPGVRVIAKHRKERAKHGVIAPFGSDWHGIDNMNVPVILDNGRLQPWTMSDLTIP